MRIGPFEILKSKEIKELKKRVISLETKENLGRPSIDNLFSGEFGIKIPYYPMPPETLYNMAYYSDVLRNILQALREEIFRNGWTFEKKYEYKCPACGQEFDYEPEDHKCPNCGNIVVEPDFDEIKSLQTELKERVNLNNQTLIEVMKEIEDDINIMDDGYVLLIKDYIFDDNEIVGGKVREILRGDPKQLKIICDKEGRLGFNDNGEKVKTCPIHRDKVYTDRDTCPVCGKKLYETNYVAVDKENKIFYLKDEVLHVSKYSPSMTYGFSPIYSIWQKVVTLWNMDRYMMKYYELQRNPKGLIFVNTRNLDSFNKSWRNLLNRVKENPHTLHPMPIETKEGSGKIAEYIDLSKPLPDMQYIETRNEMRRIIGSVYGVMPLFQADISTSGGLNNEGLQVTVTNRTVERGQQIYNEKIFPWLMKNFGVKGWNLILNPNEEKDEMAEIQREIAKTQRAQMMLNMGFDVKLDEYGEFQFSGEAEKQTLGGVAPNLPLLEENEQRFEGEPENVRRSLEKRRIYIDDPSKAPEGATVRQGSRGGYYYETTNTPELEFEDSSLESKINKLINEKSDEIGAGRCMISALNLTNQLRKKGYNAQTWAGFVDDTPHSFTVVDLNGEKYIYDLEAPKQFDLPKIVKLSEAKEYQKIHPYREEDYKYWLKELKNLMIKERKPIIDEEIEKFEKDNNLNYFKKKELDLADFLYPKVFKGLSKKLSDLIRDILLKGFKENRPRDKIAKEIAEKADITPERAEVITRTEESSLRNNLREYMFKQADPEGKFKYRWIGPLDDRTSDICKEIMEKTRNGVKLETLKKIINQTARKYGVEPRDYLPHPSCRHTFVRVM